MLPLLFTAPFPSFIGSQAIRSERRYLNFVAFERKESELLDLEFLWPPNLLLLIAVGDMCPVIVSVSGFYVYPDIKWGNQNHRLSSVDMLVFSKQSMKLLSFIAYILLNLTIISFLLTDAFNIMSLDSVNNYYRSVWYTVNTWLIYCYSLLLHVLY